MGWCVGCGGRVTCIGWCRRLGQLLRPGVFATGAVRAEDSCGRPVRAGGLGWPGQADGTKGDPGATSSRGQRSACGSGGDLSDIQCHHWFPGPKPFASWAQDIDCLDRRQCFPAYEPLYSFAPSIDLLDPNHTCPVPQKLINRTPQTLFSLAPTIDFLDPYHLLPWDPAMHVMHLSPWLHISRPFDFLTCNPWFLGCNY